MDYYKDRPVFPFEFDHSDLWSGQLDYDADVRQIGGGSGHAASNQLWTFRRRDLNAYASSLSDIEEFFASVRGSAVGFWLPHTALRLRVVAGVDVLSFTCAGTDLANRWGQDPCEVILLHDPDGNAYIREVESVVTSGSNSLVTLVADEGDLPEIPTSSWAASLLLYVCLASDDLEIQRDNYTSFSFACSVIELPFEYATAAPDAAVIYLYEIGYTLGTTEAMERFTNWGVNVEDDDYTWISAPIEHGDIKDDSLGSETDLTCLPWDGCPLVNLFPFHEGLPLQVRIYETGWDFATKAESGTRQLLFSGEIRNPQSDGVEISAACQGGVDLYARPVPPRVTSRTCKTNFCSAACGLDIDDFCIEASVVGVLNDSYYYIDVLLSQALPAVDWLALGYIGSEDYHDSIPSKEWEWRPIQEVTDLGDNAYRLRLRRPFRWLADGDTCWVYKNCARTESACKAQMKKDGSTVNNIYNYQGFPLTPLKNPQSNTSTIIQNNTKK